MNIEHLTTDEIDAIIGGGIPEADPFGSTDSEYSGSSVTDSDSEEQVSDAQQEWEESVRQLEGLLYLVLLPIAGKFFGRRLAYYRKCAVRMS
jgi:hypothetical protein